MYLQSDRVKAFPLAAPRSNSSNDITSRIFYEQNVSNLIRQIVDVDGFVISGEVNPETGNVVGKLCFNIYGYYFELADGAELAAGVGDNPKEIYVGIKFISNDDVVVYPLEISGQDENGEYTGLEFSSTKFGDEYKSLKLLEFSFNSETGNEEWHIPKESKYKFDIDNFGIDWIDAKH